MARIIYLRGTSIINDSRASKEIKTYLSNGDDVIVLGWNRQTIENIIVKSNDNCAKIDMFTLKSNYGDGFKNIFKLLKFEYWLYNKLKFYINEYDIIHACDFETAYIASKIAKKYNKQFIYDIYDYYVDCHDLKFINGIVEKMDIKTINSADCVILCTEQRINQIKNASPKKIQIVHNTPNITKKYSISDFDSSKIKICYVGILQDDRLLYEIGQEISKYPNVELHIGGFGKYEQYFKKLSETNENVNFYGQLEYEKVLQLESKCDVLFATYNPIVKNHRYSAPNKVYEAMALGKPIIVCADTGVDDLVKKEKIGCVIEYNSTDFFKVLCKMNKKQYEKMSQNGQTVYSKKYSWKVMEKRILSEIGDEKC